ncbi:MAG: lipoyl domain-containing protein [Solirubrobacterales bacterium]
MAEIVMPRLSDSMEEGTVLRWLKSVGDEVAVGDELVEIETDKANMVYESDLAGTLTEVMAQEGDTLPVGDPIARVGDASEVVGGNGGAPGARHSNCNSSFSGRGSRRCRRARQGFADRQADRAGSRSRPEQCERIWARGADCQGRRRASA